MKFRSWYYKVLMRITKEKGTAIFEKILKAFTINQHHVLDAMS